MLSLVVSFTAPAGMGECIDFLPDNSMTNSLEWTDRTPGLLMVVRNSKSMSFRSVSITTNANVLNHPELEGKTNWCHHY